MTIPERAGGPSNAELAAAIEFAAQRLEARSEISEATFVRALEAYGKIWTARKDHQKALRAALAAALSGEKDG